MEKSRTFTTSGQYQRNRRYLLRLTLDNACYVNQLRMICARSMLVPPTMVVVALCVPVY
jgi:hypothetical protein